MSPAFITVILPTHAPALGRLQRTLQALAGQDYPRDRWELLLVDNASPAPVPDSLALTAHPGARVLREPQLGLSHARIAGVKAAAGELIVLVDDDNLLRENYLTEAGQFFAAHPDVAVAGGVIQGEFATTPPAWTTDHLSSLAIRDYGREVLISQLPKAQGTLEWPYFSPIGAGMVVRTEAARRYVDFFHHHHSPLADRRGRSLGSAGDCELVMHAAFLAERRVAYDPDLALTHLIPTRRLKFAYLTRLAFEGGTSWRTFQVAYGFKPRIPAWSLLPRSIRTFWRRSGWTRRGWIACATATGEFVGRTK